MSAETPSWKTGACQASVRRRAIVLRVDVSCTTSTSAGAAGATGAALPGTTAACSTSSATIAPVRTGAGDRGEIDARARVRCGERAATP